MTGHCEHCTRNDNGRGYPLCNKVGDRQFHNRAGGDGWWIDNWSDCPACAERKRIAAAIEALNEFDSEHWEWEPCLAIDAAAKIARGEV